MSRFLIFSLIALGVLKLSRADHYYLDLPEPQFIGQISNITIKSGRDAVLDCQVKNLGEYKVGWIKASDQTILALHKKVITHNYKIHVTHDEQWTWSLHLKQITHEDEGCYMCQINTSTMMKQIGCISVLVPPDISTLNSSSDVSVIEGQNADFYCHATGNPDPKVVWKREDGQAFVIKDGKSRSKVSSFLGARLTLPSVKRTDIGVFFCIASNGVPPSLSKRVMLNVKFAPSVKAENQLVGSPLGEMVRLSCLIEAYPNALSYWIRNTENKSEEMVVKGSDEMILEEQKQPTLTFISILSLTIKKLAKADVGTYTCIASNSIGRNEATIRLYEMKRQRVELPMGSGNNNDNDFVDATTNSYRRSKVASTSPLILNQTLHNGLPGFTPAPPRPKDQTGSSKDLYFVGGSSSCIGCVSRGLRLLTIAAFITELSKKLTQLQ